MLRLRARFGARTTHAAPRRFLAIRSDSGCIPSRGHASALAAVLIVAFSAVGSGSAAGAMGSKPRLLLLPIVVHSAESPDYVRGGLADMLSARFSRSGGVELIRVDDPAMGTTKLDVALREGRKSGADYVLFGSFTRFGKGASLDVQCAPVGGNEDREPLREIFVHSGSIGEIIPDLDELAGKVSRFARGEEVGAVPPAVVPANAGSPGASPPANAAEIQDLMDRVAALEASLAQLLDEAGTDELSDSAAIVEVEKVR